VTVLRRYRDLIRLIDAIDPDDDGPLFLDVRRSGRTSSAG
jgi:hypothetical protein